MGKFVLHIGWNPLKTQIGQNLNKFLKNRLFDQNRESQNRLVWEMRVHLQGKGCLHLSGYHQKIPNSFLKNVKRYRFGI